MSAVDLVTDHALVRWLERVCGWPMEDLRAELAMTIAPAAQSGASRLRTREGIYVFEARRLVTVLTPEMLSDRRSGRW